jgi:hypothetical protein
MYLIDTNVISEARKGAQANPGVLAFFKQAHAQKHTLYLAAITVGELRRGVDLIAHRGDQPQARRLAAWLDKLLADFAQQVLPFDTDAALVWGHLRAPHAENAIDKQIAAIALTNDLTVVTRNVDDFKGTGVTLLNPFTPNAHPPL